MLHAIMLDNKMTTLLRPKVIWNNQINKQLHGSFASISDLFSFSATAQMSLKHWKTFLMSSSPNIFFDVCTLFQSYHMVIGIIDISVYVHNQKRFHASCNPFHYQLHQRQGNSVKTATSNLLSKVIPAFQPQYAYHILNRSVNANHW